MACVEGSPTPTHAGRPAILGKAPLLWLTSAVLAAAGCHRAFSCTDDAQCQFEGIAGACEPDGHCSFPDPACDSGRRYGQHGSADVAGVCVDTDAAASDDTGTTAVATTTSATDVDSNSSGSSGSSGHVPDTDFDPCDGLRESGPVVAMADGEIIEGLRITSDTGPGILVDGRRGVTIRNCEIHHHNGPGISFRAADEITIEDVVLVHDGAPEAGPHADGTQINIEGYDSDDVVLSRVRASHGSSGIDLQATPGAHLSFIEVHDVRGPGVAACVRLLQSNDAVLEDFSCENPLDTGRPRDLIEIDRSSNVVVRRGLLDGHNAEFGFGVHFSHTPGQHSGGLVEDVDGVRMTAGSFSCHPFGTQIVFRRTRARENICEILSVPIDDCKKPGPNGGCIPGSNGVSWTASETSSDLTIEASSYFDLCETTLWPTSAFTVGEGDLVEEDFEPRAPIRLEPCWE